MYNGDPNSGGVELSGTGYSRVNVTFGAPVKADIGSTITNPSAVETTRAEAPWGLWTHTVVMNAMTGGDVITTTPRQESKQITRGLKVIFSAGQISVTIG